VNEDLPRAAIILTGESDAKGQTISRVTGIHCCCHADDGVRVLGFVPSRPGVSLGVVSVVNLRDVGGYTTADDVMVRQGLVYRSNQLNPISVEDLNKVAALGLENDFDLRTAEEREARPDQLPHGVTNVWLNVLADASGVGAAEIEKLMSNPKDANRALGRGKEEDLKVYREFIALPSTNSAYRELFVKASFDEMQAKNDSIEVYFAKGLGIDAASSLIVLSVGRFRSDVRTGPIDIFNKIYP
jgi:protein-tyrosine phosphatase